MQKDKHKNGKSHTTFVRKEN
uniref:Uncharacterized protein n=1 Tax=Rhizophora mucronata TaxID=61149 RepID=A0A2P2QUR1_RHIMU